MEWSLLNMNEQMTIDNWKNTIRGQIMVFGFVYARFDGGVLWLIDDCSAIRFSDLFHYVFFSLYSAGLNPVTVHTFQLLLTIEYILICSFENRKIRIFYFYHITIIDQCSHCKPLKCVYTVGMYAMIGVFLADLYAYHMFYLLVL